MSFSHEADAALHAVAIIGMAGRFPGAKSVEDFWKNQLNGVESISHFRVEDLEVPNPTKVAKNPNYVKARSLLDDIDLFDPEFFGIHPREAELMDPQHRLFLECCWEALEDGAYDPFSYPGAVGVYAGCSIPSYFLTRLCATPGFIQAFTGEYQVSHYPEMLGNSLDFLSTRVSYKLNLRGPSFTLQAACSTSLVAVCQACQSLLTYQCDMALAGGASITLPQKRGSLHQEGGMISPDGHCRTFSADAQGTVFGSGVGVVLLKRAEDALRDGDHIYALIRGFAMNNDGSSKVGYTAPSVEGQARVIAMAHEMAGIHPEQIGYIEAHGTATPLGDPVEVAALNQVFSVRTTKKNLCALGTAKTNVGHLDVAAGVTGLIHATCVVRDGVFPPTLHFQTPNPQLNLGNSPFYINSQRTEWKPGNSPRLAGVSSFGIGGTNAHVIIQQAPARMSSPSDRTTQLLLLSARSQSALERATDRLVESLKCHPDTDVADLAWTLQVGRRRFPERRYVVVSSTSDAVVALSTRDPKRLRDGHAQDSQPSVFFLFPGQGAQYSNMGRELYKVEKVFREAIDRCAEILLTDLGMDLREVLYPENPSCEEPDTGLTQTIYAQPAIFAIEYALSQLWMSWGVRPRAMLGHSIGEFAAACLSGVMSLSDALRLITARGNMMQKLPRGGMLSVRLPATEVRHRLNGNLAIAAVNAPSMCVVAGPHRALKAMEQELEGERIPFRRLSTSHAFHSPMMDPILDRFAGRVRQARLAPPKIPFISGVTGTWITDDLATDPNYWARHLRAPVQFSAGIAELLKASNAAFLEVGPGNTLSTLARQHMPSRNRGANEVVVAPSLVKNASGQDDAVAILNALGSFWLQGIEPEWPAVHAGESRQRISLPTYPFERKRYWLDEPRAAVREQSGISESSTVNGSSSPEEKSVVDRKSQQDTPSLPTAPDRATSISSIIAGIFEDLSGTQISASNADATFLEMGFDSLFLTQVTQALQSKLNVKITFRQLLGEQSTLKSLSEHIQKILPADLSLEPLAIPTATLASSNTSIASQPTPTDRTAEPSEPSSARGPAELALASQSAVERLMREQLQAMNQLFAKQLDTLRQGAPILENASPTDNSEKISTRLARAAQVRPEPAATQGSTPSAYKPETQDSKPFSPYKPVQKEISREITREQQHYLLQLINRYTRRTATSKKMTQEQRSSLADPRVVSGFRSQWKEMVYPIVTSRSKGSRLWDVDGNEYIDILSGFGPIFFGHRPDFVERAIEQQLHQGFEIGPQTPLAGEIAKLFCEMTGNERMTFCNTGSEAVLAALRVARTVTSRNKVVIFAGAYHGMFDEVLAKGTKRGAAPHSLPVAPGIPKESVSNIVVLDYGTPESLDWIRAHATELAAVLTEPVQSRHPNLQPREFLQEIRKITEDAGVALIFDEVVTGFRTHPGGCQALFNIRADLATYGKVIGGGMPIGLLAGKSRFMDALDGGAWQFGDDSYPSVGVTFLAGTFVRHPLALAAALAILQQLRKEGPRLQENLNQRTASLVQALNDLFESHQLPARIENFASIFYFSFPAHFPFGGLLYYHLREKGIFLLEGFPCFLTTAHTEADVQQIVRAFDESLAEMQAGGVLPAPDNHSRPRQVPHGREAAVGANVEVSSRVAVAASQTITPSHEVPLTEAQLEIWLSAQFGDEASCAFNESFTLHLRGELNEADLRDSLNELLSRHESLRASVVPERNTLRFNPPSPLRLALEDLSSNSDAALQARIDHIKQEEAITPFDLIGGPVVRTRLLRLNRLHHALIVTTHHLFCDGWSTNVLLEELTKLYSARVSNSSAHLPTPVQFSVYAQNLANAAGTQKASEVEAYWLEQFHDPVQPLELPSDRPRPAVKSFKGSTLRTRLDAATYKQIKQSGARLGCTLFATLFSGFASLLHRLTKQDDIVIGIPAAGQSLLDNSSLVGHCVNFLPIRVRFVEQQTVSDLLHQVKRTLLDAYEHQTYTYGTLVRKLKLRRDPSRLPLVEIQFNLEKVGTGLEFPGLQAEVDPNPKASVNFDLFFNVVESEQGLLIDCDYNTELFDSETIRRWLGHFETLLKQMVTNLTNAINTLPLLSDAERRRILVEWNATSREYPRNKCVHELIARTPAAVAVTYEGQSLTYDELDRRSNRLARYLIKIGVTPGSLVGVAVERSPDMVVALLAIWKAGAAYVPLDPAYPRERLEFILQETSLSTLLTQSKLVPNLPVFDTHLVCLDRDWVLIAREPETNPAVAVTPDSTAYTIYTSGSTGTPKGVEVTHRNLVNLLCSMQERPGLKPQDRLIAVTTLSFDIAALELFLPLITGAQVVLAGRNTAADGRLLRKLIRQSSATVLQATPATWRLLLEAGWTGSPGLKILCGGEALPRDLANELASRGEVWNMYGPTETTVWSATSRVTAGEGPVTIGPPIHNTQFYVLDERQQLAPIGVPGELYIGGDGVARGYFRNPELTATRFVPDKFSQDSSRRLYKTGDLVRYRSDGTLEFLGRLDNQVKVRGFRIELGEIEAALAKHPAVLACAVIAQENEPGIKRLAAYVVPDEQNKPSSDGLREWTARSVPEYMVPSVFSFLPALPQTPNGKIDRKALAQLKNTASSEQRVFIAPRNPAEERLSAICAEVLQLDRIGIHDSLFDLGADSIHLFQIIARAAGSGITITPQQILRLRTIAALAETANLPASITAPETITRVSRDEYQLTPAPQIT